MDRTHIARNLKTMRIALALIITAISSSLSVSSQAQLPARAAPLQTAVPAPHAISGLLQPALDTVHQTLDGLRIDKWKKGSIRDEASLNIDSIRNDLRTNIPPMLQEADAGPGKVSKLLPVSNHIDALYDVLLRISEASRVAGPDEQAAQLQQALLTLNKARLAFNDRIQGSADEMEKQVADLRATIQQQQAAQRAAVPVPVVLPCIPPPTKKPVTKPHKPAASSTAKPATTTTTTPPKPSPSK